MGIATAPAEPRNDMQGRYFAGTIVLLCHCEEERSDDVAISKTEGMFF